jgi:prepilin-type N-terminal cleavage/methylation domain-containing protein
MKVKNSSRGFTLVEMVVAVALFAIVMLVCVGALLALVGANKKVHALQSVMDNLNVTLDGMVRDVRMGSAYDGSVTCPAASNIGGGPRDCTGSGGSGAGSTQFSYQPYCSGGVCPPRTIYRLNGSTNRIERSKDGGTNFYPVTSSSIVISNLQFYVVGTNRGCAVNPCDNVQPKVVMDILGSASLIKASAKSTFHIQVTAVQRVLDI